MQILPAQCWDLQCVRSQKTSWDVSHQVSPRQRGWRRRTCRGSTGYHTCAPGLTAQRRRVTVGLGGETHMRGPGPVSPIELTAEEVEHVHHLVRAHTSPHAQVRRVRIMVQACEHPERRNQHIAAHVGTSDRQVHMWRTCWTLAQRLADAPCSGAPRRVSPHVRAHVTAIAWSLPRQGQVPLSRWSRAEVARRVGQDPALPRISTSTVGRWIKAERLCPWRSHFWQHIHDPVAFFQRARPVSEASSQARVLWLCRLLAGQSR
jgi:hypothetical protein